MIVFDVDGVLTDGTVLVDESGREYKRFFLNDMDMLYQLNREGYVLAAITGEDTPLTDYFSRRAPWKHFVKGCKQKLIAFQSILQEESFTLDEVAYIGDGLYDIPVLRYVQKSICPANAVPDVKNASMIHLHSSGGHGCVVELYEIIKKGKI